MSISLNEDVIGGGGALSGIGGGYGGGGLFLIAILLIFMVMGGGLWGNRHPGGEGEGCADKMTWSRFANYEDPQIAVVQREVAGYAGALGKQAAIDTGTIIHTLDNQTCEIKVGQGQIIQNQQQIAANQMQQAYEQKLADYRERVLLLNQDKDKAEILAAGKIACLENTIYSDRQFSCLNSRLDAMQCQMVKQPPFTATGVYPGGVPFNTAFNPPNSGCCG